LYGEIGLTPLAPNFIFGGNDFGNRSLWVMGLICAAIIILVSLFYRQLLLTSFDAILAHSIGWPVKIIHLFLMLLLALSTVASLESVGVILVVAMLVFPSVTASFFFNRLPSILICTFPLGILYTFGGFHLAYWLDCSIAAAMAITASICFILSVIFGPKSYIWKTAKKKPS
jgi:manganese/zinc/iron transport system permease protein